MNKRLTIQAGWVFIAPSLFVLTVFFFGPVFLALIMSFSDFDIYSLADINNLRWIGLDNYFRLVQTPLFWKALGNTFYLAIFGTPLSIAVSLGLAMALNVKNAPFKGFFRIVLFTPYVTTLVAAAAIWHFILDTRSGLLNQGLRLLGLDGLDWLGDPHYSLPAIILFSIWKSFGYNMLILLAALQKIPDELYEAATLDGANAWQRLLHVTIPGIMPSLWMVSLITIAGYFQLFAEPYVMTQGGPAQSTLTLMYFMYNEGFKWWNLGTASATAFILFIMLLGISILGPKNETEAKP